MPDPAARPPICPRCLDILRAQRLDPSAGWSYEWTSGAIVWKDEEVRLGPGGFCWVCFGAYKAVWRVRTQRGIRAVPEAEYVATWDWLCAACPEWIGFQRLTLTRDQRRAVRKATWSLRPGGPCERALSALDDEQSAPDPPA